MPEAEAALSVTAMAVDPANGDEALVSSDHSAVYLIAGKGETSEYGLNGGSPLENGDAYLVAGMPGSPSTTALPTTGSPLAGSSIDVYSATFDLQGNLVIGTEYTANDGVILAQVDVVPQASGELYGDSMVVGDVYNIASFPETEIAATSSPLPNLPEKMTAPTALAVEGDGNIIVESGGAGVVLIDEATDGTLYGQSVQKGYAYLIAGSSSGQGSGTLIPRTGGDWRQRRMARDRWHHD